MCFSPRRERLCFLSPSLPHATGRLPHRSVLTVQWLLWLLLAFAPYVHLFIMVTKAHRCLPAETSKTGRVRVHKARFYFTRTDREHTSTICGIQQQQHPASWWAMHACCRWSLQSTLISQFQLLPPILFIWRFRHKKCISCRPFWLSETTSTPERRQYI
jgi:hypothetical protein